MHLFRALPGCDIYIAMPGEWACSRAALMDAAALYCRRMHLPCPSRGDIAKTPRGKPYFAAEGAPRFSISHSAGIWMAAFSMKEVGLDIQQIRPIQKKAISRRFFHPEEDAYLAAGGYGRFFAIWAAKEAYAKYMGYGIDEHFGQCCCVHGGKLSAPGVSLTEIPGPEGFAVCICQGGDND